MSADVAEILESAQIYRENGIQILPLIKGQKRPTRPTAEFLRRPMQDFAQLFKDGENIGGFAGTKSGNFHGVDIDEPERFENFRRTLSREQRNRLIEFEHSTWSFQSASARYKPGRRQILFRTEKPLMHVVENAETGFGIIGERIGKPAFSALPHSRVVGKDGQLGMYLWINDPENTPLLKLSCSEVKEFADFMPWQTVERGINRYGLPDDLWQLIRGAQSIVKDGRTVREYRKADGTPGDRSRIDQAIVFRLAALGWDFAEIENLFRTEVHYGSKFHDRSRGAEYLKQCHQKAMQKLATMPEAERQIKRLMHEMQFFSFNPRTWLTDASLYRSALEIGQKAGTLTPALSVRRLAEMTSINFTTAHRGLHRIHEKGLLTRMERRQSLSGVYQIRIYENLPEIHDESGEPVSICNSSTHSLLFSCQLLHNDTETAKHDAFRNAKKGKGASGLRRGLGKNGAVIYQYLQANGQAKAEQISASSGMARMTVFRKLSLMKETGIVQNNAGLWSLAPGHDLNVAAAKLGTIGAADEQEKDHEKQRADFFKSYREMCAESIALLKRLVLCAGHAMLADQLSVISGKRISENSIDRWLAGNRMPQRIRRALMQIGEGEA